MEVPRHWRVKKQRYRMIGEECPHCSVKIFPPRDICPNSECGKDTFTMPLISQTEKKYYGEKGIQAPEIVRETRVNMEELII